MIFTIVCDLRKIRSHCWRLGGIRKLVCDHRRFRYGFVSISLSKILREYIKSNFEFKNLHIFYKSYFSLLLLSLKFLGCDYVTMSMKRLLFIPELPSLTNLNLKAINKTVDYPTVLSDNIILRFM
jgi:hypothetical protein